MAQVKDSWGSRLGLILAMAGNAVGLGNFLRFPVQAVQNGGGAFIIPYIICFVLLGIPLMLIEWSTGKYAGSKNVNSAPFILQANGKSKMWKYVGGLGIFSNFIITAYYCYIESWTLSYIYYSLAGAFKGMNETQVSLFFDNFLNLSTGTGYVPVVLYVICLIINVWILSRGLQKGVETMAKICMPLLLVFGLFLVVKAITLKAGVNGASFDGIVGMNFLWTPQLSSLSDPKVWLAAAGQIFFTLSLGMGCVQCYASYLKKDDDIVLNSMTSGFMNEFCEIIIGATMIIPISVGYFGIDKVRELMQMGGFGIGFKSLPFLFAQWGDVVSVIAGVAFFGLLFFAGITSSLAMGTNLTAFFQDGSRMTKKQSALLFGAIVLVLGLPTVFFYNEGVFDQYDYWGGTVTLVIYAMLETILFSWIIGVDKGWKMIHEGADMKMPVFFKYVLKYVTPTMLIIIFIASLIKPMNDDWSKIGLRGWEVDNASIVGVLQHKGIGPNDKWFSDVFYSEIDGIVADIEQSEKCATISLRMADDKIKTYMMKQGNILQVSVGDNVKSGDTLYSGKVINTVFFIDMSRILLVLFLIAICITIKVFDNNMKKRKVEI